MPISKIKAGGINDDAVTTAKIVDGTVAAVDIADGAVTSAKLDTNIDIDGTLDVGGAFTSQGIDDNASSTAMTLTSSNDVAFGNTAANLVSNTSTQGGGGYVASDKHFEFATTSNRAAVEIGKNNANDGQLVAFRKQGTTVGSIGAFGDELVLGSGFTGLKLNDALDSMHPINASTGGARTDSISLGASGNRFKNLYLSGGVYVGGTTSANYLDDYEEGTWTPVDNGGNPYNNGVVATYTKIGRIVYFNFDVSSTGSTSGTTIVGLPFTASPNSVSGNWSVYGGYSTSNSDLWGHVNHTSNAIGMFVGSSSHTLNGRWIGAGFYYTES
jgi:hypothetical protein